MSDAYVGEIRWFPYGRGVPEGWLACDGSPQPIEQNQALYTLIGTTYGGDGVSTFNLPDLRGRVPIHQGQGVGLSTRALGSAFGSERIALSTSSLPAHSHVPLADGVSAGQTSPAGQVPATVAADDTLYVSGPTGTGTSLAPTSSAGDGQPHENCAPTLAITAGICSLGIFPPQS